MPINNLEELLIEQIRDIYHAENQLLKALPRMAKKASNEELRAAFEQHRVETERHVERLEEVFNRLGLKPKGKKCKGMEGLLEEGKEMLAEKGDPDAIDAGLIAAAQRVEHYEIASYGTVREFASQLGHTQIAKLLEQTLREEESTDKKLTELAERNINEQAMAANM
jgi:ferritin-like metal-binding protein YciE